MKWIRKNDRGPPIGCVIDGHRYLTVSEAWRLVGSEIVTNATIWNYAKAGFHPASGLNLCVLKQPLLRTGHQRPRSDKQHSYMLREDRVLILRSLLQDHRRDGAGIYTTGAARRRRSEELELMRDRARQFNAGLQSTAPSS